MPRTRGHMEGARPPRQRRLTEGVVMTEGIPWFPADYTRMNRSEGAAKFCRRELRRFYDDLPADRTIRYGTLRKRREYRLAGQPKDEKLPRPERFTAGWDER